MEESTEAPMDTDVSSTTDDVQEVHEVASTHRDVETVITVESIKEEEMSPRRNKQAVEAKSPEKTETPKPVPKPELTIKKIIIKSPLKDLQVRPIQKSPAKSEESQKAVSKDGSPNKPAQSSTSQKPQLADSSSKVDIVKSPNKNEEITVQSTTVNSSDSQKTVMKSPVKDTQKSPVKDSQQPESTKEAEPKNPNKDKQSTNKDPPLIVITKDKITKPPIKDQPVTVKESPKVILVRDSSRTNSTKDLSMQQTSGKETAKKESPSKQAVVKVTPEKDIPAKVSPFKQIPAEVSPFKQIPAEVSPFKQIPAKETPAKETTVKEVKQIPAEVSPVKQILAKETPAKQTTIKEVPGKLTPVKELPAKTVPYKEQLNKPTLPKDSPPPKTPSDLPEKSTDNENKSQENNEPILKNKNLSVLEEKEASNDSQMETNSDTSEKEHNKSISRELKSLINSAKESKIISECTQLTSKTRKSRTPLDTSLNASVEADKIQGVRRGSDNSQISNSSEKSDKAAAKRSMRSQNPEFVSKVKNFLNSVSGKNLKGENETDKDNEEKSKENEESTSSLSKKKKTEEVVAEKPAMEKITFDKNNKYRVDPYCWRCHWGVELAANEKPQVKMQCTVCPRSFHMKCLTSNERNKVQREKSWVCPECFVVMQAESSETRSPSMKKISLGMLKDLLKHALERMMEINGAEPFINPVNRNEFPEYDTYVVHPMDLTLMKKQIDEGLYGSTEAFLADVQWILHNCIIFNTCGNLQAKLTGGARSLVRSCRAEMGEIEACPECYAAAHARRPTWFTDVCTTPHILLWAKLKGFPFWPAKGMSINHQGLVDVRFFGAHDRAWVPARDCFLFSEKDPNNFRTKRQDILDSMQEAEQHIRNISRKYGKFVYPPFRTTFDPTKLNEQLKLMIPSFEGEVRSPVKDKTSTSSPTTMKEKRRSNSKSSKGSFNEGDTSEGEENAVTSRKMASGAEIARDEEDFSVDKDKSKTMEVDPPTKKDNETSRKRRRSELEEAVITIIDNDIREKRKRVESADKSEKKDSKEPADKKDAADKKETTEKKETPEKKDQDKPKGETPSTSTADNKKNSPKVTPIRVISIAKVMKNGKVSPKVSLLKEEEKTPKQKTKPDKTNNKEKDNTEQDKQKDNKEEKKAKRRNSNKNKSLNDSNVGKIVKNSDNTRKVKEKDRTGKQNNESDTDKSSSGSETAKSKNRIQFDDDTSLAVLARETKSNSNSGLPTISSVRSLSVQTSASSSGKTIEITVEATQDSSIFTPTSTDNVKNMREAVNKLQKLRGDNEPKPRNPPQVGQIGVRAFARMTSPPEKEKETRPNDVQIEVKAEPMDYEESDKQLQDKIDLMSACKLRPVIPPSNLRDVRINKVVVTPLTRKGPTPPQVTAMRAKKTFPQPKKPDEGRSELTSKNSMVYIPIQPPVTQAPLRNNRPSTVTITTPPQNRSMIVTSISNQVMSSNAHQVNTISSPLVQFSRATSTVTPTNSSNPIQTVATIGSLGPTSTMGQLPSLPTLGQLGGVPTVGQVPTTVHTMPLITSVNGQWTFSLQPVLSVGGGVDSDPSPPMMNGLAERAALVPLAPTPGQSVPPPAAHAQTHSGPADSQPGEPPRLQQRPSLVNPLDSKAPVGSVPPPSTVGPLTAKLNQNAVKMTDFFRSLLEDSIEKIEEPLTQVTSLKLQLEQIQWRHQQELDEIKHNHELILAEMRSSFEKEKVRLVAETRRQSQMELDAAVKLAKTKQWCANCNQEAQFYCCWNTAYCDYPCQRAHWATHYAVCAQHRTQDNNSSCDNSNPPENRLLQAPENLPKTTAAPNLAAANKLQPSRMYAQEQAPQKTSIIMSMVEDTSGNQTMKCVGTYKSPSGAAQMSPLIINKQIMSNEETAKKVVTSGGYLIVGASNATNSTTITPARRATAIQYIS